MYTTKKRIYGDYGDGRRVLIHASGARLTDVEAVRLGLVKAGTKSAPATTDTAAAKPPAYAELVAEGIALGLEFPGNLGTVKLTVLIDEEKARRAKVAAEADEGTSTPETPAEGAGPGTGDEAGAGTEE